MHPTLILDYVQLDPKTAFRLWSSTEFKYNTASSHIEYIKIRPDPDGDGSSPYTRSQYGGTVSRVSAHYCITLETLGVPSYFFEASSIAINALCLRKHLHTLSLHNANLITSTAFPGPRTLQASFKFTCSHVVNRLSAACSGTTLCTLRL